MVHPRGEVHKYECVTITLVPTADDAAFSHIPTTFDEHNRMYQWRHYERIDYLLVPMRISKREIMVHMFVEPQRKGMNVQRAVESFVNSMVGSVWQGLKLRNISRPTRSAPPEQAVRRGTIEEILGTSLKL
jgi:hypothetical protein